MYTLFDISPAAAITVALVRKHRERIAVHVLDVPSVHVLESTVGRCQASDPHTVV